MKTDDARVLVLGANGFVGAAIASGLAANGHQVYAYGRADTGVRHPRVELVQGSIEDSSLLREAIARATHIVHAASLTTPGTSARDPALEIIGNLLPLARVLECANDFPERRLIYLSSGGTVYGDASDGADENAPLRPRSYYGAGKVAAEALIHACTATTDWSASVLRPSNLYGPGQSMARGFAIVPTLFARALDGAPFHVWGDGSAVRDYCYIDDIVEAVRLSLPAAGAAHYSIYNVSSGCSASVVVLAAACERACGRPIRMEFGPARGVDVQYVAPSHAALAAGLGWQPRIDLAEGLARTWRWIESTRSGSANR
jgi:UDP-glucose 4-epimerase